LLVQELGVCLSPLLVNCSDIVFAVEIKFTEYMRNRLWTQTIYSVY